jgi:hypothetical protein
MLKSIIALCSLVVLPTITGCHPYDAVKCADATAKNDVCGQLDWCRETSRALQEQCYHQEAVRCEGKTWRERVDQVWQRSGNSFITKSVDPDGRVTEDGFYISRVMVDIPPDGKIEVEHVFTLFGGTCEERWEKRVLHVRSLSDITPAMVR